MRYLAILLWVAPAALSQATQPLALDAVDFKNNVTATGLRDFPLAFPDVEIKRFRDDVPGVVYPRGNNVDVEFTFFNPTSGTSFGHLAFKNPVLRSLLGDVAIGPVEQRVPIIVPGYSTGSATVTLTNIPNFVYKGELEAEFSVEVEPNGEGPGYIGLGPSEILKMYFTDATPTASMQTVWIELADFGWFPVKRPS